MILLLVVLLLFLLLLLLVVQCGGGHQMVHQHAREGLPQGVEKVFLNLDIYFLQQDKDVLQTVQMV